MSFRFHPQISPQHSRAGQCGQATWVHSSSSGRGPSAESWMGVFSVGHYCNNLLPLSVQQEAIMAGDYHVRAAEMHEMAAHAHRAASAGHGKQDHLSGHEQAQRAMEHAAKAFKQSQEALKQSAMYAKPSKNKKR